MSRLRDIVAARVALAALVTCSTALRLRGIHEETPWFLRLNGWCAEAEDRAGIDQ